jgi:hypothetical protein
MELRTMTKITSKPKKPEHAKAIARALRERNTIHLDPEKVRAIRASSESGYETDRRYGLSMGYTSHIRSRRYWVDVSDPFTELFKTP